MVMTLTRPPWRAAVTSVAAAAALLVTSAVSSQAAVNYDPRPGEPIQWGPNLKTRIKTYQTGNGSACSLIASPNSVGGVCLSASAFDGPTIEEVLDGDDLPECWQDKLTDDELEDIGLEHGDGAGWYWRRCLTGIDPKTYEIEEGGIQFAVGIWYYEDDDDELISLTENQQAFIDRFVRRGNVPQPIMLASPSPVPWVNDDVAFYNATDEQIHVDLTIPGVEMRGRITEMLIYPEGRDGPSVKCDGAGVQVGPDDTPATVRDACWHSFEQSSETQPDDQYRGEMHVMWQIDARVNGEWEEFHTFVKSSEGVIQVNEVQALVRP